MTKASDAVERVDERLVDHDVTALSQSLDEGAIQAVLALPLQPVADRVLLRRKVLAVVAALFHAENDDPGGGGHGIADGGGGETADLFLDSGVERQPGKAGATGHALLRLEFELEGAGHGLETAGPPRRPHRLPP